MKYSFVAVSALATLASAKPSFLNTDFDVTEGDKFTLKFDGCDSGCTIVMQTGPSDHLTDVKTLKTGITGDSFDFTPSDIPSGTYNFKIFADGEPSDPNYSKQFQYKGTGPALTTGSSASASASATSAASTSEESSTGSASATTSGSSSAETTMSTATSSAESSAASTTEASATTSEASASTSAAASGSTTVPGNAGARATPFAMVVGAVAALAAL